MVSRKNRPFQETTATLRQAFREVTLGLMGVFQLHDAEPRLVADAANMLARVYRVHAGARRGSAKREDWAADGGRSMQNGRNDMESEMKMNSKDMKGSGRTGDEESFDVSDELESAFQAANVDELVEEPFDESSDEVGDGAVHTPPEGTALE